MQENDRMMFCGVHMILITTTVTFHAVFVLFSIHLILIPDSLTYKPDDPVTQCQMCKHADMFLIQQQTGSRQDMKLKRIEINRRCGQYYTDHRPQFTRNLLTHKLNRFPVKLFQSSNRQYKRMLDVFNFVLFYLIPRQIEIKGDRLVKRCWNDWSRSM